MAEIDAECEPHTGTMKKGKRRRRGSRKHEEYGDRQKRKARVCT